MQRLALVHSRQSPQLQPGAAPRPASLVQGRLRIDRALQRALALTAQHGASGQDGASPLPPPALTERPLLPPPLANKRQPPLLPPPQAKKRRPPPPPPRKKKRPPPPAQKKKPPPPPAKHRKRHG